MRLTERVIEYNKELKAALELIYAALNNGQQKQLLKDEKVKALLEKYKVV